MLKHTTTAIGSLPHHNIDAALEFAFSFDIPFLPQIPIRNVWEYSVPQGLNELPGLRVETDGSALLDLGVWVGRAKAFDERLALAFEGAKDAGAFAAFEPSSASSSSWQPFLWEIQERRTPIAKCQTVGPLTAQWSLRAVDGSRVDQNEDLCQQIFRLTLARSLAMVRRLRSVGTQPILFLDEPALFVLSTENPSHLLGLQQVRLLIQAVQKEGALVGLHCCSNVQWDLLLDLRPDFLSFDTRLSLSSVIQSAARLKDFVAQGGRLALGVIPTSSDTDMSGLDAQEIGRTVRMALELALGDQYRKAMDEALWTPACGLALLTPSDAQTVLGLVRLSA